MKEIAQQILNSPFNWTGLTLRDLVDAGRIPECDIMEKLQFLACNFMNEKYQGKSVDVEAYLDEKQNLENFLVAEFFSNN